MLILSNLALAFVNLVAFVLEFRIVSEHPSATYIDNTYQLFSRSNVHNLVCSIFWVVRLSPPSLRLARVPATVCGEEAAAARCMMKTLRVYVPSTLAYNTALKVAPCAWCRPEALAIFGKAPIF
jgi:hypothetical protein